MTEITIPYDAVMIIIAGYGGVLCFLVFLAGFLIYTILELDDMKARRVACEDELYKINPYANSKDDIFKVEVI